MYHNNENDDVNTEMATMPEETKTSFDFGQTEKEINNIKLELAESRKEYQAVDTETCKVTQLKNKAMFILKDTQRKYSQIEKELQEIHSDYVECVKSVNSDEKIIHRRIESLTLERNMLKNEIHEMRRRADENDKKLAEIKNLITIQEKKNIALLRRLKKRASVKILTADLKEKINGALRDPRVIGTGVFNTNIV